MEQCCNNRISLLLAWKSGRMKGWVGWRIGLTISLSLGWDKDLS